MFWTSSEHKFHELSQFDHLFVAVFNGEAMSVDFGVISQNFQRSPPRLEKEIVLLGLQLFWSETGVYPLGKCLQTTMEISTIFNGKIHYFYGHFQ